MNSNDVMAEVTIQVMRDGRIKTSCKFHEDVPSSAQSVLIMGVAATGLNALFQEHFHRIEPPK